MASHRLCALCQGQKSYIWEKNHFCETSGNEPFYDSEGAFRCCPHACCDAIGTGGGGEAEQTSELRPISSVCRCLKRGVADVAFVDHLAVLNATGKLLDRQVSFLHREIWAAVPRGILDSSGARGRDSWHHSLSAQMQKQVMVT